MDKKKTRKGFRLALAALALAAGIASLQPPFSALAADPDEEGNAAEPEIQITIDSPNTWRNEPAMLQISVEDVKHTGKLVIKTVEAKADMGEWVDISNTLEFEASDNCIVYVRATDAKGQTYERNRRIHCFDFEAPTLRAAVVNEILVITAEDGLSGVDAVYVNGYEFTELEDGRLRIRLEQFDAGYPYFTISARDIAGNESPTYQISNPYYIGAGDEDSENSLPADASASEPGSARGTVVDYLRAAGGVDEDGSEIMGREFYTISTESGKVFYLIVDKDGETDNVYFLTEADENDLLNMTGEANSETLPKNSLPDGTGAVPAGTDLTDGSADDAAAPDEPEGTDTGESGENAEAQDGAAGKPKETTAGTYIFYAVLAIAFFGAAYYFKIARKKKDPDFLDEDDDDDDEEDEDAEEDFDEDGPEEKDDFFDDVPEPGTGLAGCGVDAGGMEGQDAADGGE